MIRSLLLLVLLVAGPAITAAGDSRPLFSAHTDFDSFVQDMVTRHGLDAREVRTLLADARLREDIIRIMTRPAESKPWHEYRPIFLNRARIDGGVEFWNQHAELLQKVSAQFGVDTAVIVAIIGVETRYGNNTGSYRVMDALATLGFDYPPRAAFFRKELEQFLLLAREEQVEVDQAKGSYAGAMGLGQFIPSSYRHYAVDFDGDGKRDLWNSMADILGSVANYLHVHGWEPGQPVAMRTGVHGERYKLVLDQGAEPRHSVTDLLQHGVEPVERLPGERLASLLSYQTTDGPEYWLGLNNFYVITRYNRSKLYAMAVYHLSREIAAARAAGTP